MTTLRHKINFLLGDLDPKTDVKPTDDTQADWPYDEQTLVQLLHMVEQTYEGVCSCQETFELLDEYVEAIVQRGGSADAGRNELAVILPYVQRHLELCPDCHEEYEALLRILALDVS